MIKIIKLWYIVLFFIPMNIFAKNIQLLNVSYDSTRQLYEQYNNAFSNYYKIKTGKTIIIRQSHGGSSTQANAVINGLKADLVTLALESDINMIVKYGKIEKNWIKKFPNNSSPYNSVIVFLVRKNNPKNIYDWNDLIRPGISIITPNPKSSGGAKWNYLSAWGYALNLYNNENKAKTFVSNVLKNVEVQDTSSRGSINTFFERGIGDVLISWENEAYLSLKRLGNNNYEIIFPSISILAEPVVSIVNTIVKENNTQDIANEYLKYFYSLEGQKIIVNNYYRPVNIELQKKYSHIFKPIKLFTINNMFHGWELVQKIHFDENGIYDQIMFNLNKNL